MGLKVRLEHRLQPRPWAVIGKFLAHLLLSEDDHPGGEGGSSSGRPDLDGDACGLVAASPGGVYRGIIIASPLRFKISVISLIGECHIVYLAESSAWRNRCHQPHEESAICRIIYATKGR